MRVRLPCFPAILVLVLGLAAAPASLGAADPIYTGVFSDLALQGYDPVAYFREARAVEGSKEWQWEWMGATWRFSSEENLADFRAAPEEYAPAYGGHCAWAVSQGYTAKGDARYWRIVDDRLFLNYDAKIQERWEGDVEGHVRSADENWPGLLSDD